MIYVGTIFPKLNHFNTVISSESEILIEPFKFANDYDKFSILISILISTLTTLDQDSIVIGPESTACYGGKLVRFLIKWSIMYVFSIPSTLSLCVKTKYAKRRRTKSTHLLSL